jgi:hypothetical protein
MVFPNMTSGFVPVNGVPISPTFARKVQAKQYAAKCCVEWLIAAGHLTDEGRPTGVINAPRNKKPSKKKRRVTPAKPTEAGAAGEAPLSDLDIEALLHVFNPTGIAPTTSKPAIACSARSTSPVTAKPKPEDQDVMMETENDEEEKSATVRVADLCRRLGLVVPQYRITPAIISPNADSTTTTTSSSSGRGGGAAAFFNGYADFGPDHIKVPAGLGRVTHVYGRRNAREKVAEEVLDW